MPTSSLVDDEGGCTTFLVGESSTHDRRALIGHYVEGKGEAVYKWYHPVLKMDGTPLDFGESPDGSQCGVWVDHDGKPELELAAIQKGASKSE